MKYSFVLPAYKAHFFREALDSILSQTYKDFELIIVNDASPEDLDSIVKSYDDIRIRYYVNEQNIGGKDLVAQWNHCLKYARGEYVILASDDDVYHPQYLEKMDKLVEKYPEVNVFRTKVQEINDKGDVVDIESDIEEFLTQCKFVDLWLHGVVKRGIPYYLFKRSSLNRIGGFVFSPMAWFSDNATVISLSNKGVVTCKDTLFSFRNSGINISSTRNNKSQLCLKIEATIIFYQWFELFVNELEETDTNDSKLKAGICNRYGFRKIDHIVWLMQNSLICAKVYAFVYLKRRGLSNKDLLRICYRVLKN